MPRKSDTLQIRIAPGCKTTLRELAKKKGFTMSEMVEYLILDYQFKHFKDKAERAGESEESE